MGYPRKTGRVRFVKGAGFEMQCGSCLVYVALIEELWHPRAGLTRCAACWREYKRLHEAGRNENEITADLKRTRARIRYAMDRERRLELTREWRAKNRERIAEYNRSYREAHKAEIIDYSRTYYAECRDVIVAKKRQAYRAKAEAA